MPKVFVSWYDGQNHSLANEFFGLLKKNGFSIEHSPSSSDGGFYDERWNEWYEDSLPKAISRADIFVAVITPSCDGSTWMMVEYDEAYKTFLKTAKPTLYFIRFDSAEHQIKYPDYYLSSSVRLSSIPEEAVRALTLSCS
jgi:hypothetical protein